MGLCEYVTKKPAHPGWSEKLALGGWTSIPKAQGWQGARRTLRLNQPQVAGGGAGREAWRETTWANKGPAMPSSVQELCLWVFFFLKSIYFLYDTIYKNNWPFLLFLSVQFCGINYILNVVQPPPSISRTFLSLQTEIVPLSKNNSPLPLPPQPLVTLNLSFVSINFLSEIFHESGIVQ